MQRSIEDWEQQEAEEAFARQRLRVGDEAFEDFEQWKHEVGTWDELRERLILSDANWESRVTWQEEFAAFAARTGGEILYMPTDPTPTQAVAITERVVGALRPRGASWLVPRHGGGFAFEPVPLASAIAGELRLTRGPGGGLWYDAGGVYRSGGQELVATVVQELLGAEFRRNRLSEVLAWCNALPETVTTAANPDILNVANGVLDLDTLELRPVRDDERITYQIPIAWNPGAESPKIEAFVREVVPGDCVSLVSEIFGNALMQTGRYRRSVMLLGPGSNGKSVMLKVLRELLGADNVSSVTLQALSEDKFAKAQLFSKLANVAGDLDSQPLESSGTFKTLTGDDAITADHKYGQPFQFVNYATMIFSANEWPVSHDQSEAYFMRWIAIPFVQRYREDGEELGPGERRADPKLSDRLTTRGELEGLLVRAVAGAQRLRDRGSFDVPASVREAVAEYRAWADTIVAWVNECVQPMPGNRLARGDVYGAYQAWVKDNNQKPLAARKFWPRLREILQERRIPFEEGKSADRYVEDLMIT